MIKDGDTVTAETWPGPSLAKCLVGEGKKRGWGQGWNNLPNCRDLVVRAAVRIMDCASVTLTQFPFLQNGLIK
jgi:hypothetical protein